MSQDYKKLISSKIIFFLLTTTIVLSLNLTPLATHIRHAPEGRTFTLIHNNVQDFFFYQALMNRGAQGDRLTTDPYTTEPHQPSIIFSYFVWLGKLSKLLGLPHAIVYHLIRIILSILLLFTIYYLLFTINIYPRLTFFFFLFASPLMHTINDGGNLRKVPFMNWWTGMDPIRRVAYLPHHIAGGVLLVLSVLLIIKYFKRKSSKFKVQSSKLQLKIQNYGPVIFAILLVPVFAFIHPPSLFIILITLPPTLLIYLISNFITLKGPRYQITNKTKFGIWNLEFGISKYLGLFIYWLIGLFLLWLMVSQTGRGFPWSQYLEWEKKLQFPLSRELIGAFGILLPLSVVGILKAFASKQFDYILIACWFIMPIILIPFALNLGISNVRLIQGLPYLPLAILATLGIKEIGVIILKFKSYFQKKSKIKNQKSKIHIKYQKEPISTSEVAGWSISGSHDSSEVKRFERVAIIITLIFFLFFTLPTLSWSLRDQIREYWPVFGNVYFDNRLNNAFSYINQNFSAETVTLSTFYTGNYLPAFTHTTSFIGHFGYTYNSDKKEPIVRNFFESKMTVEDAKIFLLNNKIDLIFQGPEEKPIFSNYLYPEVLKPVYDREEVTLYIVQL